jgi:hypothetical protein
VQPIRRRCEDPTQCVGPHVGSDAVPCHAQPVALADPWQLGGQRAGDEQEDGPRDGGTVGLVAVVRQDGVDRPAEQDRRQHHRRVHQDAAE